VRLIHLPDAEPAPRRVAIGMFDGVHLGHRAVIGDSDTVLTFEPHPATIVAPARTPKLLTPLAVKAELVAGLGVGEMIVIDFDREFAGRTAQSFIDEILVRRLGVTHVAVGENFRFGHRAQGDAELLAGDPRFETRVEPLLEVDHEVVSSSHIRGLILAGEVASATAFLGARFEFRGEVVTGDRRGRELGFPTANLVPDPALVCPGHGVYACLADGRPAAVSIGVRPTFETGRGELIEAYLLDFSGDLYGQILSLQFVERLRGERRFESIDALVDQIRDDVAVTREICARDVIAPPGLLP
jgi:riboflavin kinase / FMN adenylyltransferase